MKTIKTLTLLVLTVFIFGCTKDDHQTEELEQLETLIQTDSQQVRGLGLGEQNDSDSDFELQ